MIFSLLIYVSWDILNVIYHFSIENMFISIFEALWPLI